MEKLILNLKMNFLKLLIIGQVIQVVQLAVKVEPITYLIHMKIFLRNINILVIKQVGEDVQLIIVQFLKQVKKKKKIYIM